VDTSANQLYWASWQGDRSGDAPTPSDDDSREENLRIHKGIPRKFEAPVIDIKEEIASSLR
jgi:hypothetical protein